MLPRDLRLLIRADVGPRIGTGHLMRCLALGQAWKSIGGQVAFACGALPGVLKNRLINEGFALFSIANAACDGTDARETCDIATAFAPDWVVLDGYRFNDAYQSRLRSVEGSLLVVDDYGHGRHEAADAVLNQNAYATYHSYPHVKQDRLLLGSKYLLLRNEFSENHPDSDDKHIVSKVKRILVTFGGADPENVTLRTLKALDSLDKSNVVVDVVIGASYQHTEELRVFKKSTTLNLRLHRNVDRMSSLMSKVDLAISAGGSTCYELARCGIPTAIISIADNQKPIAKSLHEKGVAICCGHYEDFDGSRFAKTLREVFRDAEKRRSMSQCAKRLVDGNGSIRIAQHLSSQLYQLRPANQNDFDILLELRNEPEFRALSFNPQFVSHDSHRNWLHKKLTSPNSALWIAHFKHGPPLGYICADIDHQHSNCNFSICLHSSERGKRHGPTLIDKATRQIFSQFDVEQTVAQLKHGKHASQFAFRKAGYSTIAPTIVRGQTAYQMAFDRSLLDGEELTYSLQLLKSA